MSKATIYDVAGAAKVSLATVSRSLNNPEKVKPETRDKVLKVIKELGYKPNAFARGLASRKSTTVAVIVSDMSRASVAEMLNGISDIARVYNYSLLLYVLKSEEAKESEIMQDVIAAQVDGILYLNDEINEEQYRLLSEIQNEYGVPIVLANTLYPNAKDITAVSIDYERAGYEVTKALIAEGRKNIYMLSTVRKYMVNDLKEHGYTRAIAEAGMEPKILRTSGDININTQHFTEYFHNNEVDGVVAVRDSIAVSFMNVMINSGKSVPADVSVYGFQNTKYASLSRPKLSTVDLPIYDIGAVGMRMLTKKMVGEEQVEDSMIFLPHTVINRETTK